MLPVAAARPVLTLDALEAHDPHVIGQGAERRYLCPLPACAGHQLGPRHRSLAVNVESGAWLCFRCRAAGKLRERWAPPRERARAALRRAFAAPAPEPAPSAVPTVDCAALLGGAAPLAGSPGGRYLAGRGLPEELAASAGARFSPDFYGRPAVLFPVRDRAGRLVAVAGRYIDGRSDPKGRAVGKKSLGLFATAGALEAEPLVIAEAPCDALALARCGMPAVALNGTTWPDWLVAAAAFRPVAVALDADAAGDRAASELASVLGSFGARVERWRPVGAKDWNELLAERGVTALRTALALMVDQSPADVMAVGELPGSSRSGEGGQRKPRWRCYACTSYERERTRDGDWRCAGCGSRGVPSPEERP